MMKSLKKYLALVLALLMCLSLAACGNDDPAMVMPATCPAAHPTRLREW